MSLFAGFDTSNYTTSVAVFDSETGKITNIGKLLPVEEGHKGLMQSKALFEHIRQLPSVTEAAFSSYKSTEDFAAIGVSVKPRNIEGSYMPVFLAGQCAASTLGNALHIPLYKTAHQNGHIAAALYGAKRLDLIKEPFYAFHVSGGTTEALLVTPDDEQLFKCEILAHSLDLNCGQVIDRVGVMLGLPFPAGAKLDEMAQKGTLTKKPKTVIKGFDCCLSGVENQCKEMIENGENRNDIARYAIEFVYETVAKMSEKIIEKHGEKPFVYAGGVMSNTIIKNRLTKKGGIFCESKFSRDNAAGVSVIANLMYKKESENGR